MEWKPIETAPKTNKAILVYCSDRKNTYAVSWYKPYGNWAVFGGGALHDIPTHWMPLPDPPEETKKWKCPINMEGCTGNCGDYACGN